MTDAKKVARILRSHLGKTAPARGEVIEAITRIINGRTPGLPPILDFRTLHDPSTFERFRRALKELKLAISDLIDETAELVDFLSALGAEEGAAHARTSTLDELKRLGAEVDLALSRCGPRRRQSDRRSQWHPTANAFATFIEGSYHAAGLVPPSRSHVTSPLVRTVGDLLTEVGLHLSLDAVAKALGAIDKAKRKKVCK